MLQSLSNVLLVVIGFGLVIVVHELGHFLAARWARIRVHAFAVGFGPAVCSFRKGLGFRVGSTDREYLTKALGAMAARTGDTSPPPSSVFLNAPNLLPAISPTEYRLNWFPFGGYVKMLGQEDANPRATSSAPDSYSSVPVWKRMVVVCAGVVMNVILAAVLFVIVFMAGLREVAPVIGFVAPGSPGAAAGLRVGDSVRSIDGRPAVTFTDLQIATAMAGRGDAVALGVDRPGEATPIEIKVSPTVGGTQRMMQIGVAPASSRTLASEPARPGEKREVKAAFERAGLESVPPGSTLVSINSKPIEPEGHVATLEPLLTAAGHSGGQPLVLGFQSPRGEAAQATISPEPQYATAYAKIEDRAIDTSHILGLTPLLKVVEPDENARAAGLVNGDVIVGVGDLQHPDVPSAIAAIRAKKGATVDLRVLRGGSVLPLAAPVTAEGRFGFGVGEATNLTRIGRGPVALLSAPDSTAAAPTPLRAALASITEPVEVAAVNDRLVADFTSLRAAIQAAASSGDPLRLRVRAGLEGGRPEREVSVTLSPADASALAALGWRLPLSVEGVFTPASVTVRADSPLAAVGMGLAKTKRVLAMTYLTFARLFEGTVRVEHLKGPVGIADLGSRFAEEGLVYTLFFLGLISANLAVVNFLPLPIVDGGLFLMLCYEGVTRRPVPEKIQAGVTFAGLALIGTMFLIVTFNDVMNVFR